MRPIPYPSIGSHGVIGDRRTAALVAADGTIDWLCLPSYDGQIVFGGLLDLERGGYWRLGPAAPSLGEQRYAHDSFVLVTTWATSRYQLELVDVMAWPHDERPESLRHAHAIVRRLRCLRGEAECACELAPALDFAPLPSLRAPGLERPLWAWASRPLDQDGARVHGRFTLRRGEELWAVVASAPEEPDWTAARAAAVQDEVGRYWTGWRRDIAYTGPRARELRRSVMAVHLLDSAETGSLVAAPTSSLPERIGGGWNADYRFAWVRDASNALAITARFTGPAEASRYLDWLAHLGSSTGSPLQVLYRIDGELDAAQRDRDDLEGYRGSRPVRFGNHAYNQVQHGSLGFVADCAKVFLESGGIWRDEHWKLVHAIADHVAQAWREPDNGIWELSACQRYVSSAVMSWVALERASWIAERVGHEEPVSRWRAAMGDIYAFVMRDGWSPKLRAFRQRVEGDNLDSAALLIPLTHFLPADHPRVLATIDRVIEQLTIDHFVFRFVPAQVPGIEPMPLGEYEGAFLPCTFWLASALAMAGRPDEAEEILDAAERVAGPLGLFPEGVDVRTRQPVGNTPLAFSHCEYIRAVEEVARAHVLGRARMLVGRAELKVREVLHHGLEHDVNRGST